MHAHTDTGAEKRFVLSISITLLVLIAEVIGGLWTGSLALLSDGAHVFLDIFALGLSFLALRLSALPADDRHIYGYHCLEVLAVLANGLTLGIIAVGIFYESWQRWLAPQPVKSTEMLVIAVVGLAANLAVAFILGNRQTHAEAPDQSFARRDLNLQSAFLHVIGDAISSVGVITAAILIGFTGLNWLDPLTSVLIGLLILVSSGRVLRSSLHILIEGVPEGLSISQVREEMLDICEVTDVHDLHVWSICSGHVALSAHVVVADRTLQDSGTVMAMLKDNLSKDFGIKHTTIQFECAHCGDGSTVSANCD